MWPWLPERVVVVHIPCVLTKFFTYLLTTVISRSGIRENPASRGTEASTYYGSNKVSNLLTLARVVCVEY